jgi:hypothetical protein
LPASFAQRSTTYRALHALRLCRAESFNSGVGRSSAAVAVGQPVVENARHKGDQSFVIALAGLTAGESDGSLQRSFDHEGIRLSAGEHRARTTIRRREVGAGNGKASRVGADRSSGRQPTESEPIGDRGDKLLTRIGFHPTLRSTYMQIMCRLPSYLLLKASRTGGSPRIEARLWAEFGASQIRTVWSPDPDTSRVPSALKATA